MPRNGSGSYTPPSNTWNPATPDTAILSDDWNSTLSDMSTAISQSLASDGQTTASTVIPFAQGITVSDGLLATPSIAAISDPNTGVYFPAADQIAIVVGGVAVITSTSSTVTFPVGVSFSGSPSITGNLTLTGNLTVNGNSTIGNAPGDTLTVAATGTFTGNQTFSGTITVPDASFSNAKLATVATARLKGRVTAGTGAVEDLTGTQATTLIDAVVGATQSVAGTKGAVPAAAAGDQYKVLTGAGTFQNGPGRSFGCIITSTSVNGSTPTIDVAWNVASISNVTEAAGLAYADLTFTNALPSMSYAVNCTQKNYTAAAASYDNTATGSVRIYWNTVNPAVISVSGYA